MHPDDEYEAPERPLLHIARSAGDEAKEIMRKLELGSARLDDDAFWQRREAELAEQKAARLQRAVADHLQKRAAAMKDPLGEMLFPAIAVDSAVAVQRGTGIDTPAMKFMRAFVERRRVSIELAGGVGLQTSIVLGGGIGSGKSTAAAWYFLTANDSAPAFVRASELASRGGRYDDKLRPWLRTRSSLCIDDIGAEPADRRSASTFVALLNEIVDLFYGDRKTLVMTTNLLMRRRKPDDEPQFVERYGERIVSRMREVGGWADCGAVDLRGGARP